MELNFEKFDGLVPVIIQEGKTGMVLMLGFMNKEAYEKTIREGRVTFFSRTKNRLWTKGEESGNFLKVVSIKEDCDSDTLLIQAIPDGPVCHTGNYSCFGDEKPSPYSFLIYLEDILEHRKKELPDGSYTAGLFRKGTNAIAQKLGEEAVELIIEAKETDNNRFLNEAADLLFHLMLLLTDREYRIEDVIKVLESRH